MKGSFGISVLIERERLPDIADVLRALGWLLEGEILRYNCVVRLNGTVSCMGHDLMYL